MARSAHLPLFPIYASLFRLILLFQIDTYILHRWVRPDHPVISRCTPQWELHLPMTGWARWADLSTSHHIKPEHLGLC